MLVERPRRREGSPYNRRYLESRLAYRIQELAFGGLKPETVARLEALARECAVKSAAKVRGRERSARSRTMLSTDKRTLTVHVPLTLCRRGGRKLVVCPEGVISIARGPRIDNALVKALARAYRWQRLLEDGTYASVAEIAKAEQINDSYVSRLLRLTLLAPDIVERILDGRQPQGLQVEARLKPMPIEWVKQRKLVGS
jgi:hypothetical protein